MIPARHWALYAQLSGFYFLYYVAAGIFWPYWAVYLHSLGHDAHAIGIALGSVGLVRMVMPLGWGALMDHFGRRMQLIASAMVLAAAFVAGVPFAHSFAVLVALHVGYAMFWNAGIPAFDVVVLGHVSHCGLDYARIRMWGSVGFIAAAIVAGPFLDRVGLSPVPWLLVAGMLALAAVGWRIVDDTSPHLKAQEPTGGESFLHRVRRPMVAALFLACFLGQVSYAPFYGFVSLFLSSHGYDNSVTAAVWGVGVVGEVGVFAFAGRIISAFGARTIFIVALATTALRWLAMALLVDHLPWLLAAQLLHLSSGGLYHAVTIHYIHRLFPARMLGRAQALLTAASYGFGGALGNYLAGVFWGVDGERVYLAAAVIAAVGCAVAVRFVREPVRGPTA